MAGYREHISVSGFLGVGYGVTAYLLFGISPVRSVLAGVLTWVAGMLPDLDSESGKPIREIFSLLAAAVPLAMMGRLMEWGGGDAESAMLLAVGIYAAIRYGGAFLLKRVSVHRGMFHSLPALLIAAEATFLAYKCDLIHVKLLMAGGVALGFFSHLLLDELYAVEWTGLRLRLNKFAGSAMKLVGKSFLPNVVTYALVMVLTYAALVDAGLVEGPGASAMTRPLRGAAAESPARR